MKKVIFTLAFCSIFLFTANATVRTVSNDAKAPAQYSSINSAIQDSGNGDTILVYGSGTSYGDITIDREIILIGAGYHNPYGSNSSLNYLFIDGNGALDPSDSKISGFAISYVYFRGQSVTSPYIEGVLIERCYIYYLEFDQNKTFRDDTIRNCYIASNALSFDAGTFENIQFHNNILGNLYVGIYSGTRSLDSVYISNSVFLDRPTVNVFRGAYDLTVENCIFYAAKPQGCTNCAFNHNLTFQNSDNELEGSTGNPGSVGSGNIIGIDPEFEDYPIAGGAFSYAYDLTVTADTALNAGTDGTILGIEGGELPYVPGANPSIPQMTEITFPANASSVKVGGTLDVTFKAIKQD